MKTSTLAAHIIIIIVAVIVGSMLASNLHQRQAELMPFMNNLTRAPIGGFHKFASDVEWMKFIQYCGTQKSINEENLPEVTKRLERLISLDPNFEKAYSVGVQMLAVESPKKAVEFLEEACDNEHLRQEWRIPFYAGFIITHHMKEPDYEKAAEFYEKAIERSGTPERYVVNALVRARAAAALQRGKAYDETPLENPEHAKLYVLLREWDATSGEDEMDGGMMMSTVIPDLSDRILEAAKKAKLAHPGNAKVLATVDKARSMVLGKRSLPTQYMTPDELAKLAPKASPSTGGSAVLAQIQAAKSAALAEIAAAKKAALAEIAAAEKGGDGKGETPSK